MNSPRLPKFSYRLVRIACALAAASATLSPAGADEGVWTFDNPPTRALQSGYGFTPSGEWLDARRLSAVRLGGGSGSFVSANGLVLSNHHVAMGCLQALSTAPDDIVRNGFYARTRAEERPCPGLDLRRLESTEDVSGKVRAAEILVSTENWLKATTGAYKALREPELMAAKTAEEARLRKSFVPAAGQADPWAKIEVATGKQSRDARSRWAVGYGFRTLFDLGGQIVELANETALAAADRLPEYRASRVPLIVHRLSADRPYYKDLEIARLAGIWQEAIDLLGKDDLFVARVLGNKTPLAAATAAVEGSQLDQVAERRKLIDGSLAAVMASTDPLIVLARDVYPLRRQLEKRHEIDVETPTLRAGDELERIRYRLYGRDAYPDATFSLRLSFGKVSGYNADGMLMPFQTNFAGLYARSFAFAGRPPFDLPARWLEKQRDLDLATPLNFVSTLDIIGGNSGSPVVDRNGELVGLIFDINLEALGGHYAYTDRKARAIAVDGRAIVAALTKVYGAIPLAAEFSGR